MSDAQFSSGYRWERLSKSHPRKAFASGQAEVDGWLKTKALQHQKKHLSATKILLNDSGAIVGYYTLATGQIDFGDLPSEVAKKLPRRMLPAAMLAWLGVARGYQGQGLGRRLLAQALCDGHSAGKTFAFVAVILDCIDDNAKAFYQNFDFSQLPGHPYRLYLTARQLDAMISSKASR